MAPRPARYRFSYDEYLAYERDSGMKHEYDGGEIIAMGTPEDVAQIEPSYTGQFLKSYLAQPEPA